MNGYGKLLKEYNVSQSKLAELSGISRQAVNRKCRGRIEYLKVQDILKLSEVLHISFDEVLEKMYKLNGGN